MEWDAMEGVVHRRRHNVVMFAANTSAIVLLDIIVCHPMDGSESNGDMTHLRDSDSLEGSTVQ
jgi:hypothetical protein